MPSSSHAFENAATTKRYDFCPESVDGWLAGLVAAKLSVDVPELLDRRARERARARQSDQEDNGLGKWDQDQILGHRELPRRPSDHQQTSRKRSLNSSSRMASPTQALPRSLSTFRASSIWFARSMRALTVVSAASTPSSDSASEALGSAR